MQEHIVYKKVKDFNDEQIKKIALKYANSSNSYASMALAVEFSKDDEYTVLPRTIIKLVQKAIKKALVSEEIAIKIRTKAVHNAARYGEVNAQKTNELYTKLILQRREFLEKTKNKNNKNINSTNLQKTPVISNEQRAKENYKTLENKLRTLKHHINIYDPANEQGISLDSLISQKNKVEKQLKELKNYWGF